MLQPLTDPPAYEDVLDAAERLHGHAVRTPLLENEELNRRVGGRVLVKAEGLQHKGAFKFRGAFNAISRIEADRYPGGVVAYSSGNHAQGVAEAARLLGFRAAIVMPNDSPDIKKRGVRESGGEIIPYDRETEQRDMIADTVAKERGAYLIPPFDHAHVIAGQGTVGLEIVAQARELGATPDQVVVPAGGGGLISGVAIAVQATLPDANIIPVEPAGFDDWARSLAAGEILSNARASGSLCDALLAPHPGEMTFSIAKSRLSQGLLVSDDEVLEAMRFAFERLKLVVEPGGATALAALLTGRCELNGGTTAIVLSGSNVDWPVFQKAFA